MKAEIKALPQFDDEVSKSQRTAFEDHYNHNHKGIQFSPITSSLKIVKFKNNKLFVR